MSGPSPPASRPFGGLAPGSGGQRGRGLSAEDAGDWLRRLGPERAHRRLRTIPGRQTYLVESEGRILVVKRTRGDVLRERWYDRFHGHSGRSPAEREFDNLSALRAAGFAVPKPLLWARGERGLGLVAMECVPHDEDLEQRLSRVDAAERSLWIEKLSTIVADLHGAGFYHRDLYLSHIVLRRSHVELRRPMGDLVLLDLGRLRKEGRPRSRWFVKDLAALYHSRPVGVTAAECLRFLSSYLKRRSVISDGAFTAEHRAELRSWVRRVLRKQRRLAAHRPQFADSTTFRPSLDSGGHPG